ncbi:transposase, partial [Flavobacterium macrobrachii]|nr:transposase [Flavobacterium macrobrachii]
MSKFKKNQIYLQGFVYLSCATRTEVQLCLVHQMRNSAKYVTHTDLREVMKDLKVVYQAPSEQ